MKNQIIFVLSGIALVVLGIFVSIYEGRVKTPLVAENGDIKGSYSIQSIMSLNKPYICRFDKSDEASKVAGTIYTDGKNVYGDFAIQTTALKNQRFNSFLIIKDDTTYTWTSLYPIGYKSKVAKSATKNATPAEQSQIIGMKDEIQYDCNVWENVDNSLFEIPDSVNFSEVTS